MPSEIACATRMRRDFGHAGCLVRCPQRKTIEMSNPLQNGPKDDLANNRWIGVPMAASKLPARKKLIFHNPNGTAKIAVCPIGPNRTAFSSQALIVAVINGAGCVTILPHGQLEISGSAASGPQQQMGSAWVGIASAPGSALRSTSGNEARRLLIGIDIGSDDDEVLVAIFLQPACRTEARG
jgi:hypothetical protein